MTAKSMINSRKSYSCECLLSGDRRNRYRGQISNRMTQDGGSTMSQESSSNTSPLKMPNLPLNIPDDGNIRSFTVDEMATFFRLMSIEEHIIQRLHKKELDGKRFSKLKDSVLQEIGMKNPVICYFRDRSKNDKKSFWL